MLNSPSQFDLLKEKLSARQKEIQDKLYATHQDAISWAVSNTRNIALTGLSSAMLLSAPTAVPTLPAAEQLITAPKNADNPQYINLDKKVFLVADLGTALPKEVRPLDLNEEKNIEEVLSRNFGVKVRAELEGKRLNRSYGIIGAEQHLARFQGDTMGGHFDSAEDRDKYYSSGMAPGLGGWGHFVNRLGDMSPEEKVKIATEREKYYIAVQSFLSPGYHEHLREYIDFLGFRKMMIVNPQNGKAMIVVIGDAGPAEWTGKHLGGSPEVMKYLERQDGSARGSVLYFFLEDPNNEIPLGPIDVK